MRCGVVQIAPPLHLQPKDVTCRLHASLLVQLLTGRWRGRSREKTFHDPWGFVRLLPSRLRRKVQAAVLGQPEKREAPLSCEELLPYTAIVAPLGFLYFCSQTPFSSFQSSLHLPACPSAPRAPSTMAP